MRAIDADELLKQQYKMGFGQMPVVSVDAIKNAPTLTLPNEPLTLEELREMEGQWIIIKAFDADISGIMPAFIKDQFATTLCELGSKAIVPDLCEVHFSFNEYGKTWLAYRRPPEGEADGK